MKKDNGITLIALVVIIIVLLILAGISLNYATGDTNLIQKSKEAMFKSDAKDLKDMWDARVAGIDATNINYESVEDVIGVEKIPESLRGIFAIENGKLVYKSDIAALSDEQKSWLLEVGINQAYIVPLDIKIKASFAQVIQSINSKSADVIFVLDVSVSMLEDLYTPSGNNTKRYQAMFTALNSAIPTIIEANEKNRISIVVYGGTNNTVLELGHYLPVDDNGYFTIDYNSAYAGYYGARYSHSTLAKTNIKGISQKTITYIGGTGTRGGMARACSIINNRNLEDPVYGKNEPIIILLTDGEPNRYTNSADMNRITNYMTGEESSYTGYNCFYWTIKLGCAIKDYYKEKNLQFITINFNDSVLSSMVLNPKGTNDSNRKMNEIRNSADYIDLYNRRRYLTSEETARYNRYCDLLEELDNNKTNCDKLAEAFNRGDFYNYADKAYSGEFSTEELKDIFDEISVQIAKATDVEIGEEREGAILNVTDDMKYFNEETQEWINLKLDTNGMVQVSVVASVYQTPSTPDGTPTIKKTPAGKDMSVTYTKQYTVGQIMSGVDPNLAYVNGNITWNIRADFDERYTASKNNVRNLALQELAKQDYRPDTNQGDIADIGYIEIIVPVVIDDGT